MNRMVRIARSRAQGDGGFAMIFTLFLILVITVTSVTVADLMLSQVGPTGLAKKSVRTVDAASAGMQTALGQLRNTATNGGGDLTKLPCSDPTDRGGVGLMVGSPRQAVTVAGDSLSGTVLSTPNAGDTATYKTMIAYFATDPTPHEFDPTTSWWTANAIPCKAGLVKSVPSYAFIQSFGAGVQLTGLSATEGNRTLHAVYQFNASNLNTVGGRMAEFNNSAQDSMCMDAGSAHPTAGTVPTMQPCLALGTPQQTWQYRADLSIFFGGDTTLNLCLQNVTGTYGTAGTPELEPCVGSGTGTTYPYANQTQQEQEFAYNDNGQLEAPDINVYSGVGGGVGGRTSPDPGSCLEGAGVTTSAPAVANASMTMVACSGSSGDLTAWNPDPQVGAGMSGGNVTGIPGSPTNQLVNYALFGRCLDVNGQQFNNKLIAYPCKQAPNKNTLTWNQIWHFQIVTGVYGILYTNCSAGASGCLPSSPASAVKDCLVSPGTLNGLVYGVQCPAGTPPDNELWNATGQVVGNYPNSYLYINKADGMCMAADPSQVSVGVPQIVVTSCDGSAVPSGTVGKNPLLLKWNAPPTNPAAGLANIQEDSGS